MPIGTFFRGVNPRICFMFKKTLAGVAAAALALTLQIPASAAGNRIAGPNRYATSLAIAQTYFPNAKNVFVATGTNFPDALAAGPWASVQQAPILLAGSQITADQQAYLQKLGSPSITILGGPGAVSEQVEAQLAKFGSVQRISGANRYETAEKIALQFGKANKVYLATGTGFADALAGGALAAQEGVPIMLTGPGAQQYAVSVAQQLGATATTVLGGPGAIPDEFLAGLPNPNRIYGANRFETAFQIFAAKPAASAFLASGVNFPDALSIVPAAGLQKMPLLLAQQNCSPVQPAVPVTFVGGTGALSDNSNLQCQAAPQSQPQPKPQPKPQPSGNGGTQPIGKDCPANAPIKGNANSMIYHMPGQRYYDRTTPEACFASQADARAAGYRKAKV